MSLLKRIFGSQQEPVKAQGVPENYWINRKENVIGNQTVEEFRNSRQRETYFAIFKAIDERGFQNVLDLGCNVSGLGMLLYDWGYKGHYTGVDSNIYALEVAKQNIIRFTKNFKHLNANIRSLPLPDRSFECVVVKDVLEHMEDYKPLLTEAARVADKYLIVANFIPWTEGITIINKEEAGYYHNMYNRKEVYNFASFLSLEVEIVISALEKDARPNEIVIFKRK